MPLYVVKVLINWYAKLSAKVKFGNYISEEFKITCGVRQGGVLSPSLFCVYVDNILKKLSPYGCNMYSMSYGSQMYADDILLAAPSVVELIRMINICCDELEKLGLKLNCEKSAVIRIGPRHAVKCNPIVTKFGTIPCVKEAKYLGVTIVSAVNFKVSVTERKCNFYSSFNALYSKLGRLLDVNVIMHLLNSVALPVLTYALEALHLNKTALNSLESCLNRAIFKIFGINDAENRKHCLSMFNMCSISELHLKRKSMLIQKAKDSSNPMLYNLQ